MEPVGVPPSSRALSSASAVDRCASAGGLGGRTGVGPVGEGIVGGSEARRDEAAGRRPEAGRPVGGSAPPGSAGRLCGVGAALPGAAAGRWDTGLVAEAGRTPRPGEEACRGARECPPPDVDGRGAPAAPG